MASEYKEKCGRFIFFPIPRSSSSRENGFCCRRNFLFILTTKKRGKNVRIRVEEDNLLSGKKHLRSCEITYWIVSADAIGIRPKRNKSKSLSPITPKKEGGKQAEKCEKKVL